MRRDLRRFTGKESGRKLGTANNSEVNKSCVSERRSRWWQTTLSEYRMPRTPSTPPPVFGHACAIRLPNLCANAFELLNHFSCAEKLHAHWCRWPMHAMRRLSLFNRNKIYANRMQDNGKVISCVRVWQIEVFVSHHLALHIWLGAYLMLFSNLLFQRTSSCDEAKVPTENNEQTERDAYIECKSIRFAFRVNRFVSMCAKHDEGAPKHMWKSISELNFCFFCRRLTRNGCARDFIVWKPISISSTGIQNIFHRVSYSTTKWF